MHGYGILKDLSTLGRRLVMVLAVSLAIVTVGCVKDEDDYPDGETNCTIEGQVVSADNRPVVGAAVTVDYHRTTWLASALTRRKAQGVTDSSGRYKLDFYVKDDEVAEYGSEVNSYFDVHLDMENVNRQEYVMPADYMVTILSVTPPRSELRRDLAPVLTVDYYALEKNKTYTQNFCVPRKRYVKVMLNGFTPQSQDDRFEVQNMFPYGAEVEDGGKWSYPMVQTGDYLYMATESSQTFDVLMAVGETNVLRLFRTKNGQSLTQEVEVPVTDSYPETLTFDY